MAKIDKKLSKLRNTYATQCKACVSGADCESSKTRVLKEQEAQGVCTTLI